MARDHASRKDSLGGAGHHQTRTGRFFRRYFRLDSSTCQRTGLESVAMPLRHRWQVLFRQASLAQATRRWRCRAPINLGNLSAARRRRRFHTPTFATRADFDISLYQGKAMVSMKRENRGGVGSVRLKKAWPLPTRRMAPNYVRAIHP